MVIVNAFNFFLLFVAVGPAFSQDGENDITDRKHKNTQRFSNLNIEHFKFPPTDFCRTRRHERGRCVPLTWCPLLIEQEAKRPGVSFLLLLDNPCMYIDRSFVCCPFGQNPSMVPYQPLYHTPYQPTYQIPYQGNTIPKLTWSERIDLHPNRRLLPGDGCGTAVMTGSKIVGGHEAALDEFPWLALLLYRYPNGKIESGCGGSLINSRYVITAAHCINIGGGVELIRVRLGEHDTRTKQDCQKKECNDEVVDAEIENIAVHRTYKNKVSYSYNDIALLRLKAPVTTTRFISPICLPLGDLLTKNYNRERLTVAGWGRTSNGAKTLVMNPVKLKVEIPVMSLNDCKKQFKGNSFRPRKTQMCAGGEKQKDSCQGDSGGPLMSEELIGHQLRWYLVAIVSFGPEHCGTEKAPGIYTRVSEYMMWILDNMND